MLGRFIFPKIVENQIARATFAYSPRPVYRKDKSLGGIRVSYRAGNCGGECPYSIQVIVGIVNRGVGRDG